MQFRLDLLKSTPRAIKVVERVAQMADWGRKRDGRGARACLYRLFRHRRSPASPKSRSTARTGQIKVHNFWCTIDCGIAVQPDNVIAQTESSIVYGLGMALSERITIKDGVVEQSNFYDYHVPRMNEVPEMHVEVIKTDNPSDRRRPDGDAARGARDVERRASSPEPGCGIRLSPRNG